MASLSLTIIKTRPNKDGSFGIKIQITTTGRVAWIPTRFKIDNLKQWKDGRVVKHPDADYINKKLRALIMAYEEVLDDMPNPNVTATEIKAYLETHFHKSNSLKDFAEAYIERLTKEGRKSYAQNLGYTLKYLLECFGDSMTLQQFTPTALDLFEKHLRKMGKRHKKKDEDDPEQKDKKDKNGKNDKPISDTSINIRMSHLKALLNAAVNDGTVEYKIFPFRNYKAPAKAVRDICISKKELRKLREAEFKGVSERRHTVARDLFMLSFYCAGINLTDLMDAQLDGDTITFVRKKTAAKKQGEKEVSITIQPEAREIIDKYITSDGRLDFGYNYSQYEQFRSFITKGLNQIGEDLGFEKKLMFYSARKTFVQYGTDLGIPLYILEYAIGQTIKDKNSRPIHDYFKVMRSQADMAIRTIISYSQDMEEESAPIPEWARKYITKN